MKTGRKPTGDSEVEKLKKMRDRANNVTNLIMDGEQGMILMEAAETQQGLTLVTPNVVRLPIPEVLRIAAEILLAQYEMAARMVAGAPDAEG